MNPFLFEKDHEVSFLARNEGAYRGLTALFPGVTLKTLTLVTKIANKERLFLGRFRTPSNKIKSGHYGGVSVTHATKILSEKLKGKVAQSLSYKTCQNILNLCIDLHLLTKLSKEYKVHSYGQPLLFLNNEFDVNFKCYFIERLLFEDGDFIYALLKLHSKEFESDIDNVEDFIIKYRGKSNFYGKVLHEIVLNQLKNRERKMFPPNVKKFLVGKIDDIQKQLNEIEKAIGSSQKRVVPRRTELEYTVRRDWLIELNLLKYENKHVIITKEGNELLNLINGKSFDQDFFTNNFFSIIAKIYNMKDHSHEVKSNLFREYYDILTTDNGNILETLVLINTIIFLKIPNFVGERNTLLMELLDLSKSSNINLVVENGYRTRNYYIKKRY